MPHVLCNGQPLSISYLVVIVGRYQRHARASPSSQKVVIILLYLYYLYSRVKS